MAAPETIMRRALLCVVLVVYGVLRAQHSATTVVLHQTPLGVKQFEQTARPPDHERALEIDLLVPSSLSRLKSATGGVYDTVRRDRDNGATGAYDTLRRDRDNGELVYMLRSVAKNAAWIRKIHIVVNGA